MVLCQQMLLIPQVQFLIIHNNITVTKSLQVSAIKQSIHMSLHPLVYGLECFTA